MVVGIACIVIGFVKVMDDDDDDGATTEARDGGCGKVVACSLLFWL